MSSTQNEWDLSVRTTSTYVESSESSIDSKRLGLNFKLGDSSMLLDEVAMELASSATRNSSSGEIAITAGGNYLKACGKHGNDDDDDDDDDSFQGRLQ